MSEKTQISALTLEGAAEIINRATGNDFTKDDLQVAVYDGLPTNSDGTISLVILAAWCNSRLVEMKKGK